MLQLTFMGTRGRDSIVLVDSFRYVAPNSNQDSCILYDDEDESGITETPATPTEPTETPATPTETPATPTESNETPVTPTVCRVYRGFKGL